MKLPEKKEIKKQKTFIAPKAASEAAAVLLGYEELKDHEFSYQGETKIMDGVKLIFGYVVEGETQQIRTKALKLSLNERSTLTKYLTALNDGVCPDAGSELDDLVGKSLLFSTETVTLQPSGKLYTGINEKTVMKLPKSLRSEAPSLDLFTTKKISLGDKF